MNAARIKQEIEELRVQVNTRLDALAKCIAEEASDEPPPEMMTIAEYAEHASVSISTVRRWLDAGLPCKRRGRTVRIKVAEADAWSPEEHIKSSAKHAAHRGGR
jgi:excisionase family DNA binding protein